MPLLTQNAKPRVILGTMTFGPDEAAGARVTSLDEYNRCLDFFQKEGYNEIDTARVYVGGKQEAWSAEAHWKERGLTLATKWYPSQPGFHKAETVKEQLNKSLSELKTDCVDIFYLHAADRSIPFEETLQACNELHKEGKFVQLGLSNFTAFEVAEIVIMCNERGWVRPSIYQGMYNAITRSLERELIPACKRYGIDVVVYNPLAGGLFSGKIKSADIPAEGRYSDTAKSGAMYRKRYFKDATFEALRMIEQVAQKHNLTLLEIAIRWCVHHSALEMENGGRDGVIIGVSSYQQLEGNLKDFDKGPLPEKVVKVLDDAWLVTAPTTPNYWHLDLKYTYDTRAALFKPKESRLSAAELTWSSDEEAALVNLASDIYEAFTDETWDALPSFEEIWNGFNNPQFPSLEPLLTTIRAKKFAKSAMANNVNGGINRQGPAPVTAQQQGNGNVNGNGMNANGYGSMAHFNASQQMDMNFVNDKLKEFCDVERSNRVKSQGIVKSAEQLAARAAASGTNPSLSEANEAIQTSQLAELALALRTEQQKTAILLREQQANTALLAQYEEGVGTMTAMVRNFKVNQTKAQTDLARHYNGLLQAEKDEHLATRLERDEYMGKFMRMVEMLRTAARMSSEESEDTVHIVAGLQSEVRTYRAALGLEREAFEQEGGYEVLRHVTSGAGERMSGAERSAGAAAE